MYASVYACATDALLGETGRMQDVDKQDWISFLNGFQSDRDGLFRDQAVQINLFENSDWWGARHLTARLIIALSALGGLPTYPFRFLDPMRDKNRLRRYLQENLGDFDPAIMAGDNVSQAINFGVLLQYSRNFLNDKAEANAVALIQEWQLERINPENVLWSTVRFESAAGLSRTVQFAYHLFPILAYDGIALPHREALLQQVVQTQNELGVFGEFYNSSACEDIDSVEIIYCLTRQSMPLNNPLRILLTKARLWVLANQNDDGGSVFKRNEPFEYGYREMSSEKNERNMFATWFRTLSLAYLTNTLNMDSDFRFTRAPGYHFK